MNPHLSIVYDITRQCPWNCKICCMGAQTDAAALQNELPMDHKLSLMEEIAQVNQNRKVHLDFSGGEIFTDLENLRVVERAAGLLGRESIGISASGFRVDDALAERLSACVSECELTMDVPPGRWYALRPRGYSIAAARAVPHLRRHGIRVGIQTVLARSNTNAENLTALYRWLCDNGVNNWSFLRFYPVGRGSGFRDECLSTEQEFWAIRFIQQMDKKNASAHKPEIDFHYTMMGHEKSSNQCRCVTKSIGILPNGDVTACFWALDSSTEVINPKYLLGSLTDNSLPEILNGARARYWTSCTHTCELGIA